MKKNEVMYKAMDGNEAAADIGYRASEVCAIYPITPASNMGEYADQWATERKQNAWGLVPMVVEMQSEAGAIGALHGASQTGTLSATFTASQGLLLMIPNMYKIAGELSPCVIHVSSRSVATQSMSIYCDHSDVMSTRGTGFGIIAAGSVQEAHDMAMVAHAASLESRVPFLHFFDGFRTSHEISKIEYLTDENIRSMIDQQWILDHRNRRLSAENPFVRGTVENSDVFFQGREAVSVYYDKTPDIVNGAMRRLENITGRHYELIEYFGHSEAERVIVLMTSGSGTVYETISHLMQQGEKIGMIQVRLFRPFSKKYLLKALPKTCRSLAILDRTKEPGSSGEPLYQEVSMAIIEAYQEGLIKVLPKMINGRYGISGKEFTPGMVRAILDELKNKQPKNHFTVGIVDDICHTHLVYDENYTVESPQVYRALFYGLGADGTVGANKNTIKIIGEETRFHVQGYFVFDSKKSGGKTVSHLRFGPDPIRSNYLINRANFIACHQYSFVEKMNVLELADHGATFLLNSIYSADTVWDHLPREIQRIILEKNIQFYVIDAYTVAKETQLGQRINTIMQTCFFALSGIMPKEQAIAKIKESIKKTYSKKGEAVLKKNYAAVDLALAQLHPVKIPGQVTSALTFPPVVSEQSPDYVKKVIGLMLQDKGDRLPVSAIPCDGTFPAQTTRWEKRSISLQVPSWNPENCIQCGRCTFVCPHSAIRAKQCSREQLTQAPSDLKHMPLRGKDAENKEFLLQVYAEDCMGCELCVRACPAKTKALEMKLKDNALIEKERQHIAFFDTLPYAEKTDAQLQSVQGVQFIQPLFEFCGACAGCGEASYVRLMSQLFGDRMLMATACGCALVYGSNLPVMPWVINQDGCGPSYSGSLFEDNAEFAFGYVLSEVKHRQYATLLLKDRMTHQKDPLYQEILEAKQDTEQGIREQRKRVFDLKKQLKALPHDSKAQELLSVADHLIKHSIWALGGDGWAYDIGYGGLDHVIASNLNVNIMVLDTEVYSNTGGQASKASSRGAVVKFAAEGKKTAKKDLGLMAMMYGHAYVATISLAANPAQAIQALREADAYEGPSLVIAYCPCIAHGIDMRRVLDQEILAVKSGYWPLYRYNPSRARAGLNPMQLDSKKPDISLSEFTQNENRFQVLARNNPEEAARLAKEAQDDVWHRWKLLEQFSTN